MSAVGRFDDGDYRWYQDPTSSDRYESVTAIIGSANDKSVYLVPWAARLAAEFAVDKHDFIGTSIAAAGKEPTVALIAKAAKRLREIKADLGTYQHNILEALILDNALPSVPDHLVDIEVDGEVLDIDVISDGLLAFVTDFDPKLLLSEATISNELHRYAGTLDALVEIPGLGRVLVDLKTGNKLDNTVMAQLAAYRRADTIWLNKLGDKAAMVPVDRCAVLHLRSEYARGYKLIEVPAGDPQFRWFTTMASQYHQGLELAKLERTVLYPPLADGSQPLPLVEDVQALGRYRGPLVAADITTLPDLAGLTLDGLLGIKGIGEKAPDVIVAVLATYGLTLGVHVGEEAVA